MRDNRRESAFGERKGELCMDTTKMNSEFQALADQLTALVLPLLPSLVGALLLLIAGWWLAGWTDRTIRSVMGRRIDPTLIGVLATVVRYAIIVVVLVAVLAQLGIQTTSILAALGAVGLAVGLAMQGTLSNIAAGLMLLWLRPFRVGDYVDTGSVAGTVKELGLFACELQSWDGVYLFVPNSELWNKRIVNFSRYATRLVDLKYGVSYDDDLAKGQEVLLTTARADERTLAEPEPIVFVDELGDSAVVLRLRCWVATPEYWPLRRALTASGKLALEAAGLTIPFPQRDVHIKAAAGDETGGDREKQAA
jgi:small conductance mechanosensitive channel